MVGAAIDPLFLSVLAINKELSCLYMQKGFAIAITTLRSLVDIMYMWQIWLQLKLAYVSKKSLILGQGELVWDARKIARHYLLPLRRFWFDAFVILPIPQVLLFGHYHCLTYCEIGRMFGIFLLKNTFVHSHVSLSFANVI